MARGLITRAVPGTEAGTEIALKHSEFHSLPRVSIDFKFNNKYTNTHYVGVSWRNTGHFGHSGHLPSKGSAVIGGTGRLVGHARSVKTCSRTS